MAAKLKGLTIERIDLVDKGANQKAHVTLFKRAPEEINKVDAYKCPDCGKTFDSQAAMEAHMAEEKQESETAKRLAEKETELAAMKKRAEDAEAKLPKEDEDPVVKAAIDPVVKAAIKKAQERAEAAEKKAEAAQEEVAKATEEREKSEYIAKAKELSSFGPAREFGPILQKVAKALDPVEFKTFWKRLASADHVLRVSEAFKELGVSSAEEGEPGDRLTAMAQDVIKTAIAKGAAKPTFEQAYEQVLRTPEGRDLYASLNRSK
jgi:hypothetical protein